MADFGKGIRGNHHFRSSQAQNFTFYTTLSVRTSPLQPNACLVNHKHTRRFKVYKCEPGFPDAREQSLLARLTPRVTTLGVWHDGKEKEGDYGPR